ncbi:SH3 domain-containing protein [Methylobacterium sp. A54F]
MVRDVRAGDTLALRAQPSSGASKVAALPPGTRGIDNLGCIDGRTGRDLSDTGQGIGQVWCRIRIGSLTGWASARFLREDAEILKPYSISGPPTGPGEFVASSTLIEKKQARGDRWKIVTQLVVSRSTTADVPNEVNAHAELVDCHHGRSEVIRLGGDDPGYSTEIRDEQGGGFKPALAEIDEYNLWWFVCRGIARRYGGS